MKRTSQHKIYDATRLAICFAFLISGFSTVWAGPNEGSENQQVLGASKTVPNLGVAHLSAVVSADGKLIRGSGAKLVVPVSGHVGDYIVTFRRNVRDCTYVATLGNTGSQGVPKTGVISATGAYVNANGVYIDANDINGYPSRRPFHLNVFCHK